ncbi:MAG TPA: hypothetical protein VNF73_14000 [Candidatus Saccharimonadales bacterium]|nr:hypothetical protein [Candidatus Saccharimonadales bacterium]
MKARALLSVMVMLSLAGCGSVQLGPTPTVEPSATAVVSVGPSGVPTGTGNVGSSAAASGPVGSGSVASGAPAPGAGLSILPCVLDPNKSEVCQQAVLGVTSQVSAGSRVYINVTLRNNQTVASAPISMLVTGPSVTPFLLSSELALKGCSDDCTNRTNAATGTYEAQWPPIPAGATETFTMNLASIGQAGDIRSVMRLYTETMDELEANALLPTDPAKLGVWDGIDMVILP